MGIIDRLKEIFPKTITGRQGPDVIRIDIPTEIYVKELAIYTATSLIANAISQSEIKVYKSGKSVQDEDYYSLNIKPNKNESASQFWHKVVEKLLRSEDGVLCFISGRELFCADDFTLAEKRPFLGNVYSGIVVDDLTLNRKFTASQEWDASQLDFAIEKNYHPVNHLICLGSGDLKDRHVIHLFTDENGGIQPYSFHDNPYQDADYILDKRNQILKEQEEVVEVYDYGNAQDTVNYVLLTSKPQNWQNVYTNFFIAKDDKFEQLTKTVEQTYEVLASQPSDWGKRYASYFKKNGSDYANVDGVVQESYVKMSKKPADWDKNYAKFYI